MAAASMLALAACALSSGLVAADRAGAAKPEEEAAAHGVVVGAAGGDDDRLRSSVEVKCGSLKYTMSCDLNRNCDAITCTGADGEEIVDAFTPEDAAELLQSAVDAWASDRSHICRARETLGEGPSCMEKLFVTAEDDDVEEVDQDLPLASGWTIWEEVMGSGGGRAQYSKAMREVSSFATVQNFWEQWSPLPQPSELLEKKKMVREEHTISALMVFREGVRPEWEDKANAQGGHFQYNLNPSFSLSQANAYWKNLVMAMIGSALEPADMVTGIRLVDKLSSGRTKAVRLEVWFSNYKDTEAVKALRRSVELTMAARLQGNPRAVPRCETKSHSATAK